MKLELEVLDGPQKGQKLSLKPGLQIGQLSPLDFNDAQMAENHSVLSFDHKNTWVIECLAPARLRLGQAEVPRATLILGLIFHIGQTGFKVVEKVRSQTQNWNDGLKNWLTENPGPRLETDLFFFRYLVRVTFTEGLQFEEHFNLSYGPRILGFNSLDLNVKDPSVSKQIVRFFQVGEQAYIENLCGELVKINGQLFDQHPIQSGDTLKFSSNVIELSVLK